jgi:hypothetical protein
VNHLTFKKNLVQLSLARLFTYVIIVESWTIISLRPKD